LAGVAEGDEGELDPSLSKYNFGRYLTYQRKTFRLKKF
jgi:hypothetical protein